MLPKFLIDSYKRYKSDTSRFLEWLEQTARDCDPDSQPVETLKTGPAMTKSQKKKTKKRIAANKPADLKALPKAGTPLSHFVTLANAIVDSKRDVKAPPLIAALISRAIALRKRCSAWFSTNAKAEATSNKGHSHFVSVLEDVVQILGIPSSSVGDDDKQEELAGDKPGEDIETLGNRFSVLEFEEAREDETVAASAKKTGSAAQVSQKADAEVFDDTDDEVEDSELDEAMFAAFCLLEDLRNLRNFISQIWEDYRENKVDLMSTAVTTNTAIDIARQSSEEFLERNATYITRLKKRLSTTDNEMSAIFFYAACMQRGEDQVKLTQSSVPYNPNLADVAELCYFPTCVMLNEFRNKVRKAGSLLTFKSSYFCTYNASLDRSNMDAE